MNEAFLNLSPKRVLCPYCGKWHDYPKYNLHVPLKTFYCERESCNLDCSVIPELNFLGKYSFHFSNDGIFNYTIEPLCQRFRTKCGKILISSFIESKTEPIVTTVVKFTAFNSIGREICFAGHYNNWNSLYCKNYCNLVKLVRADKRNLNITLGFEFDKEEYEEIVGHKLE